MNRADELERRLWEWAGEYGGGKYDANGWPGYSTLSSVIKYHGRPPQGLNPKSIINTAGDEVEAAVVAMEASKSGWRAGRVLRCEYWEPDIAMADRLQRLQRIGCSMAASSYAAHLRLARVHVAAWLHIPSGAGAYGRLHVTVSGNA